MEQTSNERRTLRYDFTVTELAEIAMNLAIKTKELQGIEEEKASVAAQFASKIKEAKATCNKLSNHVADGYEYREVDCLVMYHKPASGKKSIVRKDSDKIISVEKMSDNEWNLFNQPEDAA